VIGVKICGITRISDAQLAVRWGVNALGFIFAESPRRITPEKARDITRKIPPFVKTVGVFVNEKPPKIKKIVDFCGLDLVQLHGNETVSDCSQLGSRVIKAFRVQGEDTLNEIANYKNHVRAILLDTYQRGIKGGTGSTFDWGLAIKAKKSGIPMMLSGGLRPENILEALEKVAPSAIDVSSGIEKHPGIKDHDRMGMFMERVVDFHRNLNPMGDTLK